MPTPTPAPDPLLRVALEIESYVAQAGWDQRPRLFGLVPTAELLAVADAGPRADTTSDRETGPESEGGAGDGGAGDRGAGDGGAGDRGAGDGGAGDRGAGDGGAGPGDDSGLSAVEQDWTPSADLEADLARVAWPETVSGVALVVERLVVPPEAERGLPSDPDAALAALAAHPDRRDVRLVAAVTRAGGLMCLLRQKAYDSPEMVAHGPEIATGLLDALAATLVD
jgi:hypothetical protein